MSDWTIHCRTCETTEHITLGEDEKMPPRQCPVCGRNLWRTPAPTPRPPSRRALRAMDHVDAPVDVKPPAIERSESGTLPSTRRVEREARLEPTERFRRARNAPRALESLLVDARNRRRLGESSPPGGRSEDVRDDG